MWRYYSRNYIKNNRASSISIMAAALAATMFLSLLCSIAYNFWMYDIEKIMLEEGDWQGRIVCETFDADDLSIVCQFANVEKAVISKEKSNKNETVINVYFRNARTIYRDLPFIAAQLGQDKDSVQYNSLLLSR